MPVFTPNGRGQAGQDRSQLERTLIGLARNPNVAAALLVNYDRESTEPYVRELRAYGKPVEAVSLMESSGRDPTRPR